MRFTDLAPDQDIAGRVAAEVRAEMTRQGISQETLCSRIGWSQQRLSRRVTAGKTAVALTVAELTRIADALGVPVTQFLPQPAVSAA